MQLDLAERYIMKRLTDELPAGLTYHNAAHTNDVLSAAKRIARQEGIDKRQLEWLLTAALFHDAGFLINAKNHEIQSCAIAQQVLPDFGYTESDIRCICELIMATAIPQRPKQHLEEIICDADLDYLGRDDFFDRSELLFREMRNLGTVASRDDYNERQLVFLRQHHYFTDTANGLRNRKKEENYQKLIV